MDTSNFISGAHNFVDHSKLLKTECQKCLLNLDVYSVHLSIDALKLFNVSNIIVYALPGHLPDEVQKIKLVPIYSFKNRVKKAAKDCVLLLRYKSFDIFDYFSLLKIAYSRGMSVANICAGCDRAGIWKFNPDSWPAMTYKFPSKCKCTYLVCKNVTGLSQRASHKTTHKGT